MTNPALSTLKAGFKETYMLEADAKRVIRVLDSSGRISMGMYDRDTPLLTSTINSNRDYAIFQDKVLIGYIKGGKLVWLEESSE